MMMLINLLYYCLINRHTQSQLPSLTVCIVVNGEKFQSHAMTLTLIRQCPMSNLSELFSYTTICSSLQLIEPLFFELSCTQTLTHRQTHRHQDRKTDRHANGHEYSIVAVNISINYYWFDALPFKI